MSKSIILKSIKGDQYTAYLYTGNNEVVIQGEFTAIFDDQILMITVDNVFDAETGAELTLTADCQVELEESIEHDSDWGELWADHQGGLIDHIYDTLGDR